MSDEHSTAIVEAPQGLPERPQMHPLVELAVQGGSIDPENLEKLLAVQERWEAGQAKKAYARAKTALKRDLPTVIGKDQTVDFTNTKGRRTYYTHSSLAGAMAAVTGPLTAHGFDLSWIPGTGDRGAVTVTCRLTHAEGHHEECSIAAPADTSGSKNPAQAIASTITLLSRYTALSLLGIATADMVDPTGEREQSDDDIDPRRNMNAVRAMVKAGRAKDDAVELVGRPVPDWTIGDLRKIAAWLAPPDPDADPEPTGELTPEEEERMEAEMTERDGAS